MYSGNEKLDGIEPSKAKHRQDTIYTSRNMATTRQDNLCLNKPRRSDISLLTQVTCLGVMIDGALKLDIQIRWVSSLCFYYLHQL